MGGSGLDFMAVGELFMYFICCDLFSIQHFFILSFFCHTPSQSHHSFSISLARSVNSSYIEAFFGLYAFSKMEKESTNLNEKKFKPHQSV